MPTTYITVYIFYMTRLRIHHPVFTMGAVLSSMQCLIFWNDNFPWLSMLSFHRPPDTRTTAHSLLQPDASNLMCLHFWKLIYAHLPLSATCCHSNTKHSLWLVNWQCMSSSTHNSGNSASAHYGKKVQIVPNGIKLKREKSILHFSILAILALLVQYIWILITVSNKPVFKS